MSGSSPQLSPKKRFVCFVALRQKWSTRRSGVGYAFTAASQLTGRVGGH